ncbi:MAG: Gfo/Idh/MocA family oxidoreductase [Candidatus Eremiobacteraeota bacterium]|nr:Gfo/Idh/MocA family oxidoreductase [Candidatus Eremiobacteraeota bacterium]
MKVGVVGSGYWGQNLVRVCAELGILESVCDANEAALAHAAQDYPEAGLEFEMSSLLERNIDAVVIAAPAAVHAELALEAIASGKHVFVEKPLAMSVEDAATVVRAARAGNRTLFVGHVLLYHPAVQRLVGLIREGAIGDVRHMRSRRLSFGKLRAHENVWWSFAPHDVALALEIFEAFPESVRGSMAGYVRPHIADFAYADLQFANGGTGHIEVGWLDPDKSSRLDVFGSKGVLRLIDSRQGAELSLTPCGDRPDALGHPELWREDSRKIDFTPSEPLKAEMRAFVDAVQTGVRPLTDGEEGLRVVQVLSMLANHAYHPSQEAIA